MSDHESLRAELARVTKERDALLAERERTAPLVAAARAYAKACEAARATKGAWEHAGSPRLVPLASAVAVDKTKESAALFALVEAARALPTDGGSR